MAHISSLFLYHRDCHNPLTSSFFLYLSHYVTTRSVHHYFCITGTVTIRSLHSSLFLYHRDCHNPLTSSFFLYLSHYVTTRSVHHYFCITVTTSQSAYISIRSLHRSDYVTIRSLHHYFCIAVTTSQSAHFIIISASQSPRHNPLTSFIIISVSQ